MSTARPTTLSSRWSHTWDTPIEKEECINHTHKRMASLPKNCTSTDWQYWVTLTMPTFKTLKLWLVSMRKAVFVTLFHLMSTNESPHHNHCPTGQDSWCFFNKAITRNEEPAPHAQEIQRPLKHEVADQLFPVYQRMADPSLLKRLAKGKTQNANECLHSVIWSKCPKTVFVGKQRVE